MPAGPAFTIFSLFTLLVSVVAVHPTGRASLARRHAHVAEARNNGEKFYLEDNYEGNNFFDMFNFYSDADPTHGLVDYVPREEAASRNLTFINEFGQAVMRIDKDSHLEQGEFRKS